MLYQYKNNDGKVFNLAPHNNFTIESENIFTTIVGQNGTGKSRLLASIIEEFTRFNRFEAESKNYIFYHIEKSYSPTNIIAISISPFDKFPLAPANQTIHYTNLGLKRLNSKYLGRSYISNIVYSLLEKIVGKQEKTDEFLKILNYLGYIDIFDLRFETEDEWHNLLVQYHNLDNKSLSYFKDRLEAMPKKRLYNFFFNDDFNEDTQYSYFKKALKLISLMSNNINSLRLDLMITNSGIQILDNIFNIEQTDILFLLESGIIRLHDINLYKKNIEKHFSITEASSGEQSVIMSMLGIASKIENGSLICIDEPEICLHPAWQEKYIKFLMNTFKDYKGCHFIIATHSPQITSKLEDENCYVMSMDDGKLVSASTLNNKSIDFQLAHIFKSPGFKNEYLTRELISLITLISEGKGQEELHSTKIEEILALKDVIDDDDPVKELIKMVESVKKELS